MIQIESVGATFTLDTSDPEYNVPVKLEGSEFVLNYFRDKLSTPAARGMFGHSISLDSVCANDLFAALVTIGAEPRYIKGKGSVPPGFSLNEES